MLCIKCDLKTFKGRFSGITKSRPVGMPLNAARNIGAKISVCSKISKFLEAHDTNPFNFLLVFFFFFFFLFIYGCVGSSFLCEGFL